MFEIEVRHEGLKKYRLIQGNNPHVLKQKAVAQEATWKALETIKKIDDILIDALSVNNAINWDSFKDNSTFLKSFPQVKLSDIPQPPKETDGKYQPDFDFFDLISSATRREKIRNVHIDFSIDHRNWLNGKEKIAEQNDESMKQNQCDIEQWEKEKAEFLKKQQERNEMIDNIKELHSKRQADAIVDYCGLVLSNSKYPDIFPKKFELDYNVGTKILVTEYFLPSPENLPKVKEVKYVTTKDELMEVPFKGTELNRFYDDLIYKTTLRTVYELYKSDTVNAIDAIVFNGWVRSIDKATGQEVNACILSVQANRQEFLAINLENIDPKACFRKLKGVGSSQLHSLTPIAPILNISREDKRFISSYEVADGLDESNNLAAMDWGDFEHLIRELFEKEFSQSGGEVKVTQASRDGGVDAIAFDPDPIRGGKIVIQAKRYTNTVGVSAVRDLYGTVLNEGATKGLLVTTADYGPDAYDFAKGKPLTLLNGSNLLHLLEKHGRKATINLQAAKKILLEKEKQGI